MTLAFVILNLNLTSDDKWMTKLQQELKWDIIGNDTLYKPMIQKALFNWL